MSRGDGVHSFGHGSHCYWCGVDGESPEIEKPCDEHEHVKPSDEVMAAYRARHEVAEQIADIARFDYATTESIEWDEMIERIQALRPKCRDTDSAKEGIDLDEVECRLLGDAPLDRAERDRLASILYAHRCAGKDSETGQNGGSDGST